MTVFSEAMRAAGYDTSTRLHAVVADRLRDADGDHVRAARALWGLLLKDEELRMEAMAALVAPVAADMQGMSGRGHRSVAEGGQSGLAPSRQQDAGAAIALPRGHFSGAPAQNGDAAGHPQRAEGGHPVSARPSPASREAGQANFAEKAKRGVPAREPSEGARAAALAAHKSAASAVNRRFGWLAGLYERKGGQSIVTMTYGQLRTVVNTQRKNLRYHVQNACTTAHVAIVARKLLDACDAKGVVPHESRWADILPQDEIDRFESVWTKEKITREFVKYLADADERTLEAFLALPQPEVAHVN